jgi:hypothetical protein
MHQGACIHSEVDLDTSLRAFRGLPVGVAVWQLRDPRDVRSFRFVGVNPACERELRTPLTFAMGKPMTECFPKLLDTPAPERYRTVVLSGKPDTLGELVYRDARIPEGVFWVECFPLPEKCVGIALENITDRKRTHENQSRALEVLHRITVHLNETPTVLEAAQFCVDEICKQIGWPVGRFFLSDEACVSRFQPNSVWHFCEVGRFSAFRKATELYERDVTNRLALEYRAIQGQKAGLTRSVGFSVVENDFLRGVLEFSSESAVPLDENFLRVISNVGLQLGQVFARERAVREQGRLQQRLVSQNADRDAMSKLLSNGTSSLSGAVASLESLKQGCLATASSTRRLAETTRLMRRYLDQLGKITAAPIEMRSNLHPY